MAEFDFDVLEQIEENTEVKLAAMEPKEDLKAANKSTPFPMDTKTLEQVDKAVSQPKVDLGSSEKLEPVTKISNGNDYDSRANGTDGEVWEVVGGGDNGGIVVREKSKLSSAELPQRLATSSLVKTIALEGERLHYKLLSGTGPEMGWVSLKAKGKIIVMKTSKRPPNEDVEAKDIDYTKTKAFESELPMPAAPAKMRVVPEETTTPRVETPCPPVEANMFAKSGEVDAPPVETPTPPVEKNVSAKSCEVEEKTPILTETPVRKAITSVEHAEPKKDKGSHHVLSVGSIVFAAVAVIIAVRYLRK